MIQSASEQVAFRVRSERRRVRFEGQDEVVGPVVLSPNGSGTIKSGSIIQVNYCAPITNVAAINEHARNGRFVACTNRSPARRAAHFSVSASGNVLTVTFTLDTMFEHDNGIEVKGVRVNANAYGSPTDTVTQVAVLSAAVPRTHVRRFPITFIGSFAVPVADISPTALIQSDSTREILGPFPTGEAEDLLHYCLNDRAIPTKHFREELRKEHLELQDAWRVLQSGHIFQHPEPDIRTGEWKYTVEGYETGGKYVVIVFSFKAIDHASLITIYSIESRRRNP